MGKYTEIVNGMNAIRQDYWRYLCGDEFNTGECVAFSSGIRYPNLNPVIQMDTDETRLPQVMSDITRYYQGLDTPWTMLVTAAMKPRSIVNHLNEYNMKVMYSNTSMYLAFKNYTLPEPRLLEPLDIVAVDGDRRGMIEWLVPIVHCFDCPQMISMQFRDRHIAADHPDTRRLYHYLGYFKGRGVSTAALLIYKNSAIITDIAVIYPYRKAGFGSAMTLHAMAYAKSLGVEHMYLDASSQARTLYERLGFEAFGDVHVCGHVR